MNEKNVFFYLLLFPFLFFSCSDDNMDDPDGNGNGTVTGDSYREGITRISDDSLAFVLFAPGKSTVHLIGDFNDWTVSDAYRMEKDENLFRLKIGGLEKDREYVCQYLIDNKIRIADPYANKLSDPVYDADISPDIYPNLIAYPAGRTTEIAMVVSTGRETYNWQVGDFKADNVNNLVIYEILIRDFTEKRSIKGV